MLVEYLSSLTDKRIVTKHNYRRYPALLALALLLPVTMLLSGRLHTTFADDAVPIIYLNGPGGDLTFTTTFNEDSLPKPIVNTTALEIEYEPGQLTSARAIITNADRPDWEVESLAVDGALASGLVVKYTPTSGELTITGQSTVDKYQNVLRSLTYHNTSQSPDETDRTVSITVSHVSLISSPAISTVNVVAVNDAPVLDNSVPMKLGDINEDAVNSNGNTVTAIILSTGIDSITDADGDLEGLAIIEAGAANGVWQYSINGGATWTPFGPVSNESALLLKDVARIRFVPAPNYNGPANLHFRAWDHQGDYPNGATGVDVSVNGDPTPFSKESGVATIQILSVNDLPVIDLNGGEPGVNHVTQFFEGGPPVPVATVDATIVDADHANLQRLTVTLTNRPDGAEESLAVDPTGTKVTVVPYDPTTGQLVINGPDTIANFAQVLRTITYNNKASSPLSADRTVTFVAFDGLNDGPAATTTVVINYAPILDPLATLKLDAIDEDTVQPAGMEISQILASAGDPITDPDSSALEGIAVVGADNANGQWQYSTVNPPTGTSWLPVGVVNDTAALLLSDAAWLRFVPAADFYGSPGSVLTFRAWDRTFGVNGQQNVDVSINGGGTAFSVDTNTISIDILPINDPPELDLDGIGPDLDYATIFYINRGPVPIVAPSLVLTDPDHATLESATIRITNLKHPDSEFLDADVDGTEIAGSYDSATGVLILTGVDSVANYQQVLRTVTYDIHQAQPDTEDRVIEFTVADALSDSEVRRTTVSLVVAPDVHVFLPLTIYRRAEEPNDTCAQAMEVYLNVDEPFHADDEHDWFYFDLPAAADVTVSLTDFLPPGQILIYKKTAPEQGCGAANLEQVGHNGEQTVDRTVPLGQQAAGRYYIWIIADEEMPGSIYHLFVKTTPTP